MSRFVDNDKVKEFINGGINTVINDKPSKKPTNKKSKRGVINTHGTVDKRISPTNNINVKYRVSSLSYIEQNSASNYNLTLVLNHALEEYIKSIDKQLDKGDVSILGD